MRWPITEPRLYVPVFLLTAFIVLPTLIDSYLLNLFIMIFLFTALGSAWNLVGGYGGQFSLGHAAFFGLGAYIPILLQIHLNLTPWVGLIIGVFCSVALSIAVGAICFRLRGHYFAISTIIICEVLRLMFLRERWLTGGGVGLSVPYKGNSFYYFQFLDKVPYYYIAILIMLVTMYVTFRIARSKNGYYLRAIGQNHDAAEVIGINTAKVKMNILAVSAVITSICGTFWTQYMYFIDPDIGFGLGLSIEIACIPVVGGMGTVLGPFIGALTLRPIVELTLVTLGSTYSGIHLIVYALFLIVIVIWRPGGLIGFVSSAYEKVLLFLPGSRKLRQSIEGLTVSRTE